MNANEEREYTAVRLRMVTEQIEERGLRSQRLLAALRAVPRHCFVPERYRRAAYQDGPLPIGQGQTISQPFIVALMTDLLELSAEARVLEVGTGSGYQAAVLSLLAGEVHTLERHAPLAQRAAETLSRLGYANVQVHTTDGSVGWQPAAPYSAILVAAAAPSVPAVLLDQLADGGRLVLPVGNYEGQNLERWTRRGNAYETESITRVSFVPLRGAAGWAEGDWESLE